MKGIYLLLGSNMGDSMEVLDHAISEIEYAIGEIVKSSSIYKTKAWGIEDQPDFLNQVVEVETKLIPEILLQEVNKIEEKLGRVRYIKWHARIIDIDILYYGGMTVRSTNLVIPHPENENRNFALIPMAEIAPDFIHPVLNMSQAQLLQNCRDTLDVELLNFEGKP